MLWKFVFDCSWFVGYFCKRLIWDLTEWQNQLLGINSEKTDHWDTITTVSGVFLLLLGLWALYIFFLNGF